MSDHSKLPWRREGNHIMNADWDGNPSIIPIPHTVLNMTSEIKGVWSVDCDFMLKAVNNHEKLVDVLQELRSDIDMDGCHESEHCGGGECPICKIDEVLDELENKP